MTGRPNPELVLSLDVTQKQGDQGSMVKGHGDVESQGKVLLDEIVVPEKSGF